jgi:GDP-L-fucose synthase
MMARVTGYPGEIRWDASKPDGTPKRPLDYSKLLEKGWSPKYKLLDGLRETYKWFTESTDIQTR